MGYGDQLIGSGLARGAKARGKRIAFGDGRKIIWDQHSEAIFRFNPNIAPPGTEQCSDIEWLAHYKGHRAYNRQAGERWVWNYDFKPIPGEIFFSAQEREYAAKLDKGFVVIEPNLPEFKSAAPNKRWSQRRYAEVAKRLAKAGHKVIQFVHGAGYRIEGAWEVKTPSFRHALAVMARSSLYIGPEGGLHHGAAAVAVPAVVLFGGFIPPAVTGYDFHTNLTGGAEACGSLQRCQHCIDAMDSISVGEVLEAALKHLNKPVNVVKATNYFHGIDPEVRSDILHDLRDLSGLGSR